MSIQQHLDTPSDAYIDILDNLLMASGQHTRQRWLLTAARNGDGVTTTAIGLAHTLAALNKRTLLVDANFHDASLSADLSRPGLLQLLQGECSMEEAVTSGDDNRSFSILTAGGGMENPLLLMDNDKLGACMESLSDSFEFVLIDAPAFDSSLDAQLMVPHVQGCIVVVRAEKTGKQSLLKIRQKIEKAGGVILGLVFNRERRLVHNISNRWV